MKRTGRSCRALTWQHRAQNIISFYLNRYDTYELLYDIITNVLLLLLILLLRLLLSRFLFLLIQ